MLHLILKRLNTAFSIKQIIYSRDRLLCLYSKHSSQENDRSGLCTEQSANLRKQRELLKVELPGELIKICRFNSTPSTQQREILSKRQANSKKSSQIHIKPVSAII